MILNWDEKSMVRWGVGLSHPFLPSPTHRGGEGGGIWVGLELVKHMFRSFL